MRDERSPTNSPSKQQLNRLVWEMHQDRLALIQSTGKPCCDVRGRHGTERLILTPETKNAKVSERRAEARASAGEST